MGARFAKWRAVIAVSDTLPSATCVNVNAHALARYAALCQEHGVVPIVEPEVLMDGSHTIERCEEVGARCRTKRLMPGMEGTKISKQASGHFIIAPSATARLPWANIRLLWKRIEMRRTAPRALPENNGGCNGKSINY